MQDIHFLQRFLSAIENKSIAVIGDVLLDEYLWTKASRISPEAPVQVLNFEKSDYRIGGAGNVAINIRKLKCDVYFFGIVGNDENAKKIREFLEQAGVHDFVIQSSDGRPTSTKTRILASNQQVVRIDRESRSEISLQDADIIISKIKTLKPSAIVLSDYAKGILSKDLCRQIIEWANELEIPVIVDPKGNDYEKYAGATLVTPNQEEATAVVGKIVTDKNVGEVAQIIQEKFNIKNTLITRSEKGMFLRNQNKQEFSIMTKAKQVYDVTGAGDTVAAFVAAGLAGRIDLLEAVSIANIAAGICVSHLGVYAVGIDDLYFDIQKSAGNRLLSVQEIKNVTSIEKRAGKKVNFVRGVFDVLDAKVLRALRDSKQNADVLIVGIESGGAKNSIQDRADVILGLQCVDYVVILDSSNIQNSLGEIIFLDSPNPKSSDQYSKELR